MFFKKSKETKTTLTNEQRKAIIKYKEKTLKLVKSILLIGSLLTKRQKIVQYSALENTLYEWILQYQKRIILSDKIIVEKVKTFTRSLDIPKSDFKFLSDWLQKFKKKYKLKKITKHREDVSVNKEAIE
ncbi:41687_t:CDS:2, partial [Gigaspora margarita]